MNRLTELSIRVSAQWKNPLTLLQALQSFKTRRRFNQAAGLTAVAVLLSGLFVPFLRGWRDGSKIPADRSVLSETPCFVSGCHATTGSTLNSVGSLVLQGVPDPFLPGQTYDLTVEITGGTVYGIMLAAVYSDNTAAGTLTPVTAGLVTRTIDGVPVLHHSPESLSSGTIEVRWTAPVEPKEPSVIFKVASNAANNNFSPSGDHIRTLNISPEGQRLELPETLYFAQFANGEGLTSQIILVNLEDRESVTGTLTFTGEDGGPMTVNLNSQEVIGDMDFTVLPGALAVLTSDGTGPLRTGAVTVRSDRALSGTVLLSGDGLGAAGVPSSASMQSFRAPIEMDAASGIRTGVALFNPDSGPNTLQAELRDPSGTLVATGTATPQPLNGKGHTALFVDQFQFDSPIDLSSFRGVLTVTASAGPITATVIRQSAGELAAFPATEVNSLRFEVVEAGTDFITALEFAPDGRLFYATQDGQVLVKTVDFMEPWNSPPSSVVLNLEVSRTSFESGLIGLTLDPGFSENRHFYVYYTAPGPAGAPQENRIVRYTLEGETAGEETLIVGGLPAREDQQFHFGGGLSFGPDGKLYLIYGDSNRPEAAQDPGTVLGSLLRYNPDGSLPDDNPFPGSPVYAFGLRNGFGLAWRPETGQLFESENGTSCDDELNRIEPGGNYGWGVYQFDTCPYPDDQGIPPVYQWNPVIAPGGLTFYDGARIPEWSGDLLVCSFNNTEIDRLKLDAEGRTVISREVLHVSGLDYSCRVDLEVGPDGWLYSTTDSTILRLGR